MGICKPMLALMAGLLVNGYAWCAEPLEIVARLGSREDLMFGIDGKEVPVPQLSLYFSRTIKGEIRDTPFNFTLDGDQGINTLFIAKGVLQAIG